MLPLSLVFVCVFMVCVYVRTHMWKSHDNLRALVVFCHGGFICGFSEFPGGKDTGKACGTMLSKSQRDVQAQIPALKLSSL